MPKQKITKEMVVEAAFELARAGGMEQVMVRSIAGRLGCSVQPIYSYCRNMEGLRQEVLERAAVFVRKFVAERIDKADLFRSTGQTYLRLAEEEPWLFKMFILRRRQGVSSLEELYRSETNPEIAGLIAEEFFISLPEAKQLHLHMLIYTIGLGTIFSVTSPGLSADEILEQQETAYRVFSEQVLGKKGGEQ